MSEPINLVLVTINDHLRIYDETVEVLGRSFAELGHTTTVTHNLYQAGSVNILVGALMPASRHYSLARRLAGLPYTVYQLEPLDPRQYVQWPEYSWLLRGANVILDPSPANILRLEQQQYPDVYLFDPASPRSTLSVLKLDLLVAPSDVSLIS